MSHLFVNNTEHEKDMFLSAYNTITNLEAWEILKNHNVQPNRGFVMDSTPEIVNIMNSVQKDYNYCHSGCSMAITMRVMHDIAKNEKYK